MSDEQNTEEVAEDEVVDEQPGLFDYTDENESTTDAGEQYRGGGDDDYDGPFSQDLRELAKSYEFSDQDLEKFETPDQLRAAMTMVDKAYSRSDRGGTHTAEEGENQQPQGPPPNKLFEKADLGINEEFFEPEAVALFKKLQDRDNERVDHLNNMAQDLDYMRGVHNANYANHQQDQSNRFREDMDTFFSGLDGFEDVFGTEDIHDVSEGSPKYNNRMELVREMDALAVADQHMGREFSVAEIQQRALRLLHGDRMQEGARREVAKQVNKRRGTARPTNRQGEGLSGEERARKKLNEKYRELGFDITPVRDSSDF